jgi:hypothetical protein
MDVRAKNETLNSQRINMKILGYLLPATKRYLRSQEEFRSPD